METSLESTGLILLAEHTVDLSTTGDTGRQVLMMLMITFSKL